MLGKYQQFGEQPQIWAVCGLLSMQKSVETWKYLCFWPSGMKPGNISCYMAYLDGFFSRLLQHSDRFCYVIVSVSGLGLIQQKQKYLKENMLGGGREGNGNYTFSKLSLGLWGTLLILLKKKIKWNKINPKTCIIYTGIQCMNCDFEIMNQKKKSFAVSSAGSKLNCELYFLLSFLFIKLCNYFKTFYEDTLF